MKILFLYTTREGQTKKIIDCISEDLAQSQKAEEIQTLPLREHADVSAEKLAAFDVIILAASIRYGHFPSVLKKFINQHHKLLNQKLTAFISVNLTARKPGKNAPETNIYTRRLLENSVWKPNLTAVFAGALYYPRYHFLDRILIQFIMRITGGETDSSKEIEYTDWQKVRAFAQELLLLL